MAFLPPDLDRLGDQLARAAGDSLAARRLRAERRARVALAAAVGALAFVALTPANLGRAMRDFTGVPLVSAAWIPSGCDHLHGNGLREPRCVPAAAAVPHRPYAWR
jgi:ABC-type enterobactin transport system permease subunit